MDNELKKNSTAAALAGKDEMLVIAAHLAVLEQGLGISGEGNAVVPMALQLDYGIIVDIAYGNVASEASVVNLSGTPQLGGIITFANGTRLMINGEIDTETFLAGDIKLFKVADTWVMVKA